MTSSSKLGCGLTLNLVGFLLFAIGLVLSFTLIGAVIGIPMICMGLPLLIWGIVWRVKGSSDKAREAITRGIREGLSGSQLSNRVPPQTPAPQGTHLTIQETRLLPPVELKGTSQERSEPPISASVPPLPTRSPREPGKNNGGAAADGFAAKIKTAIAVTAAFLSERRVPALVASLLIMTCIAGALFISLLGQSKREHSEARGTNVAAGQPTPFSIPFTLRTPIPATARPRPTDGSNSFLTAATPSDRPQPTPPASADSATAVSAPAASTLSFTRVTSASPSYPRVAASPQPTPDESEGGEGLDIPATQMQRWAGEQFPETRTRVLSQAEVEQWSFDRLRYAINEMFARYGAEFGDKRVSQWFRQYAWYQSQPQLTFDQIESAMPKIERDNVKLLGNVRDVKKFASQTAGAPSRGQPRQSRLNASFPADPIGQTIGRFFQSLGERPASGSPQSSPARARPRR